MNDMDVNVEPVAMDLPVAFRDFARSLRRQPVRDRHGRVIGMGEPHADEVWMKHIGIQHGKEKHTPSEWHALIDQYRHQPAYKG